MNQRVQVLTAIAAAGFSAWTTIGAAQADTSAPERRVMNGVLVSERMPVVRIGFHPAFTYVGAKRFILYDVADAEQHLFADADASRRLRRLYWVQFEAFLPTNTHTYEYEGEKVTIGGLEFIVNTAARPLRPSRPGSDGAAVRETLEGAGYRLPDEILFLRLVHLTDASNRAELMIIYAEDLAPTGYTAADLQPDGKAAGRWADVSAALLKRAVDGLTITRPR